MANITLHHLNASRSERIFWILEELGIPYNVKVYYRGATRAAPPELKEVNPIGKAPVIEADGTTIYESGAIVSYLLANYPHPTLEDKSSPSSVFWAHFAEGSLMTYLQGGAMVGASGKAWATGMFGSLDDKEKEGVGKYATWFATEFVKSNVQPMLVEVEKFLAAHPEGYFSGSDKPGEGDFLMFFPINSLLHGTRKDTGYDVGPATRGWMERVRSREACARALERMSKEEESQKKAKI